MAARLLFPRIQSLAGAARFTNNIQCARNMSSAGGVTIRYFDSRGRAQPLRYALVDSGLKFKDDKVSIQNIISGNWFNMKANDAVSGPFGTLPVLEFEGFRLAQTEAIAQYLFNKLGHAEGLSPEDAAVSASIVSLSHQDIVVMCLQVLNVVGTAPDLKDAQIQQAMQTCQVRMNWILPRLEKMLGSKQYFLKDSAPVMADYFVFDALDTCKLILGEQLLDSHEGLKAFFDRMASRPKIAEYLKGGARPVTLTGAMQEGDIISRLRSVPKL